MIRHVMPVFHEKKNTIIPCGRWYSSIIACAIAAPFVFCLFLRAISVVPILFFILSVWHTLYRKIKCAFRFTVFLTYTLYFTLPKHSITPAVKCRRILRKINFHLQGGRRRRSGATSTDDNIANGNLGK